MNVDWAGHGTAPHTDAAFPTLAECLAPLVPGAAPVAVYYYPGRTLHVVQRDPDDRLVTRDVPPVGAPAALLGPGERWDADLRCVVRTFPHDPGLPALAAVVRSTGAGPADVLSYLPGRRAVLRATGPHGPLVVKVGDVESLRRNHSRHLALHGLAGRSFRVSRPDSLDEEAGLRREELLEGVPLVRALAGLAGPEAVGTLAADLAVQVAALHGLDAGRDLAGLPLADHTAPVAFARWQRKTLRTIGRALPALAPRAAAVVDGLAGSVPAPGAGVVHGDLHAANVHVGPAGPVLLDLDELGRGDRELDVAVLVGRLLLVSDSSGRADTTALARAFVAAHDTVAAPLRGDVLAWYLAGTLVGRQVKTSIRHLAPDLAALCARLVGLAEVALQAHTGATPRTRATEVVDRLAEAVVRAPARV